MSLSKKFDSKVFQLECGEHDLNIYSVKIGEKGKSVVYIERKEDLDALIQSYKDSCGLDAMVTLLKRGQISADALADDGKHSGDGTIPTELGPASEYVKNLNKNADILIDALGLTAEDLAANDLNERVRAAIVRIAEEKQGGSVNAEQ